MPRKPPSIPPEAADGGADWSLFRGTGHVADLPDERDYPVSGVRNDDGSWKIRPVGALMPPGLPTSDVVELPTYSVRDQGPTNECVAFTFSCHINARIAYLYKLDPDHVDVPSEHAIYCVARRNNEKDENGNYLIDNGSSPREAALGMMLYGIVSEKRLPWDPATVNSALPWDVLTAGFDAKIAKFHKVAPAIGREAEFIDELERLIASGFTIPYAQFVDQAFNEYSGEKPIDVLKGTTRGTHYTNLTGYNRKRRVFKGKNSWGKNWGKGGDYEITYDRILSAACFDFIVLTVIPDPRNIR